MQKCMAMTIAYDAGLTSAQLHNAFGIDQSIDLTTFNALGDAMQSPGGIGLSILKVLILHTRLTFSAPRVKGLGEVLVHQDVLQHLKGSIETFCIRRCAATIKA